MSTVLRVEQGIINTSKGDYHLPIIYIDEPLSTSGVSYKPVQFKDIRYDYIADYNPVVATLFTMGSRFSVVKENNAYYFKVDNYKYQVRQVSGCWWIPPLIVDSNGNYGVWALTFDQNT